jgi:hypothetical protein
MRLAAWLAAGLTCLALSLGACGGDDDERPSSAYTQRDETAPSQSERDSAPAENDSGGEGAARSDGGREEDPGRPPQDEDDAQQAPFAGGRGGNPGQPPRRPRASRDVRITVAGFLAAMRAGDPRRACAFYTREVRALVGATLGGTCANGMEFVFLVIGPNRPALRRVAITGVELSGDRASAELRLPHALRTLPMLQLIAPDARLSLEREAGRWRLGLARP